MKTLVVGQRLRLKILLLPESTEDQGEVYRLLQDDSARTCSTVLVVREPVLRRSRELAVCVGRSRVRPLYTTTGDTVTLYATGGFYNDDVAVQRRFLVIFEGSRCRYKQEAKLSLWLDWIEQCFTSTPGYMGDGFTGQKTQPTVSKY